MIWTHNMANGGFNDLPRRTVSDKILHDKAFNIAKNAKYNGYQESVASMVYTFFNKKTAVVLFKMKSWKIKS